MTTVTQILKSKRNKTVYSIAPTASVLEAVRLMGEKNIGGLLVLEGGNVVGVLTERDLARKAFLMAKAPQDTPVREIMTSPVMYVSPDQTSEECMALMTENRFRHLPVLDKGKLVGLVSIGDLVKIKLTETAEEAQALRAYISS